MMKDSSPKQASSQVIGLVGAAVALAAVLVGCATGPSASDPNIFRQNEAANAVVCSALTIDVTKSRLMGAWERCIAAYNSPSAPGTVGPSPAYMLLAGHLSVEATASSDGTVVLGLFSSGGGNKILMLMADIKETPQCKTEVTARGRPIGWRAMAAHTAIWLENPKDRGPLNSPCY